MTTSNFTGDFARLVPRSPLAKDLFSDTLLYIEKNNTFHLKFIDCTVHEPGESCTETVEDSTDYDTAPDTDTEDPRLRSTQRLGQFILSFDQERTPALPNVGWRVGKGTSKSPANRGVDFLLAKPGDKSSRTLANVHMLFRFNLKSGFLMLKASSPKANVEFKSGGTWGSLEYGEEHLLHQPATMLRVGGLEYELEYTVKEVHREAFFQKKAIFLQKPFTGRVPPQPFRPPFQKLPGDSCVPRGRYLEFGTQGSGAFGWISQGVDTKTGDPVAVKELRVDSKRSRAGALDEVAFGKRFLVGRNQLGILLFPPILFLGH
jgi:hypothetical protein